MSVDPFLAPHFAHRERVYMFPNPYAALAWGVEGLPPLPDPDTVEWVALRPVAYPPSDEHHAVVERLRNSDEFDVVVDDGDVLILRRVPAAPPPNQARP